MLEIMQKTKTAEKFPHQFSCAVVKPWLTSDLGELYRTFKKIKYIKCRLHELN